MSGKRGGRTHNKQRPTKVNATPVQKAPLKAEKSDQKRTPNGPTDSPAASGDALQSHPPQANKIWADLPQCQGELFYACMLSLYSVLALFLQYLNLYKTLWWLPKSHWHYSVKLHMINPYLLSVIGLMLGLRATKCFWNTITDRMVYASKGQDGWQIIVWRVVEYAFIKTPLVAVICSSFAFGFSRVFVEFRLKTVLYFIYPVAVYVLFFKGTIRKQVEKVKNCITTSWSRRRSVEDVLDALAELDFSTIADIEQLGHTWPSTPDAHKYCIFTGLITAYYAIFVPRAFVPDKTLRGRPQFMLIDDIWVTELCVIVALTAFSLYVTYFFPLQYLDLLYRYASQLGHWEKLDEWHIDDFHSLQNGETIPQYSDGPPLASLPEGYVVQRNGAYYKAHFHKDQKSISAEPGNKIGKDPVALSTYICVFQALLVGAQFWLLVLTTDWQHIVTQVLLMFANYLLLAKVFKDRVVIGRVFHPSSEDIQL
ncbi:transmembrane protein 39b, partial [Aphelenchoides avenae]